MTSFVVSSADKEKRVSYIREYCLELGIDKFDITLIEKDSSTKNVSSIGIDEIKDIHKKIFLKPVKSSIKAIILEDAELLTIESQNALLKVLEEPPEHTIIILGVTKPDALLPTILSRCQVIELQTENIILTDVETSEYEDFINKLSGMKIGARLKKAEELAKDKDKAVEWIGKLILVLRDKLLDSNSSSPSTTLRVNLESKSSNSAIQQFSNSAIKKFQSLHTLLKTTNVNPRFAIENTFISI